jgi:hypothetical protein
MLLTRASPTATMPASAAHVSDADAAQRCEHSLAKAAASMRKPASPPTYVANFRPPCSARTVTVMGASARCSTTSPAR